MTAFDRNKKENNAYRLIQDLSFPKGQAINDGIDEYKGRVSYSRLSDAVYSIRTLGPGCSLAKIDIEHAFKLIPVHPDDVRLLGFRWNGMFWADKTLPMGLRTSCAIFETFSTALEYILRTRYDIPHVHHVLDDFILICQTDLQCSM